MEKELHRGLTIMKVSSLRDCLRETEHINGQTDPGMKENGKTGCGKARENYVSGDTVVTGYWKENQLSGEGAHSVVQNNGQQECSALYNSQIC